MSLNIDLQVTLLEGHGPPSRAKVLWQGSLRSWLDSNAKEMGLTWGDARDFAQRLGEGGAVMIGGGAAAASALIATSTLRLVKLLCLRQETPGADGCQAEAGQTVTIHHVA